MSEPAQAPPVTVAAPKKAPGFVAFLKGAPIKTKLKVGLILMAGFFVVAFSLWGILSVFTSGPEKPKPKAEAEHGEHKAEAKKTKPLILEIKDISFSTMDKRRLRNAYVQFSLLIQAKDEASLHVLEMYRAKLLDLVYEVSSSYFVEDFVTPQGAIKFKDALQRAYVDYFKDNAPAEISFKEWVLN